MYELMAKFPPNVEVARWKTWTVVKGAVLGWIFEVEYGQKSQRMVKSGAHGAAIGNTRSIKTHSRAQRGRDIFGNTGTVHFRL